MWLYAKTHRKPPIKCCNHWSIIVCNLEFEAIGKGVVLRDYSIDDHKYVKEWEVYIDDDTEVFNYLIEQIGKGYEFSNFFFHILKVAGFRWLGIYNDNRFSCIELVNRVLQIAGVEDINKFDNPYETQVKLDSKFEGKVIKGGINK
jgi:hypothetical protein